MKFLVMGAGSIGSVVGGFLFMGGHQVLLVGKGEHAEAVKARGLRIKGIWGEHDLPAIPCAASPGEMARSGFRPQWILLSVKSYDTGAALSDLRALLPGARGVVSLQNGLGNLEAIHEAAPGKAVGARVIFGARTVRPGEVEVTVCADDILLGPAFGGPKGVAEVVEAFRRSGLPCRYEENILSYVYDKVLYNSCLNALATILHCDYGSLAESENTRRVISSVISEFYAVARAAGVKLISPGAEDYEKRLFEELIPPTARHRSSMQEDIEAGRRTEIGALNGAVAYLGEKHGVDTPVNKALARMVGFLEERALRKSTT